MELSCGNGYENLFLDDLREMYGRNGVSMFAMTGKEPEDFDKIAI